MDNVDNEQSLELLVIGIDEQRKINSNMLPFIENEITNQIDEAKIPLQFNNLKLSTEGYIELYSANQDSMNWLLKLRKIDVTINALIPIKFHIRMFKYKQLLPKFTRIEMFIPIYSGTFYKIKNRFQQQNPGLDINLWRSINEEKIKEDDVKRILMEVEQDTINYLEKNSWQLYFGLKKIQVVKYEIKDDE